MYYPSRYPLADGISKVELVDHIGDDIRVVNAARVSMAKESDWEHRPVNCGPLTMKVLSERDRKLIQYLAKHSHWTPFSHVMITLRLKMPIFVARQWFKHQIGFTRNEVSRRYVDAKPEFYVPEKWRKRAENVKQGSSDEEVHWYFTPWMGEEHEFHEQTADETMEQFLMYAGDLYEAMLAQDVCPEQARMILPQNMYTEFYETASLAAYARLCKLRLDNHAQWETRQYAWSVHGLIMDHVAPESWKALTGATEDGDQ